jgi:hypothetical protein
MKGRIPTLPGFFDEDVEAARCGVTVPTLRKWRYRGYGPKAVRIGRVWMYPENADTQFMFEQAAAAESARQPRPRGRPRGAVTPRVVAEQAAVDTQRQPRPRGRPRRSGAVPEPRPPLVAKADAGGGEA